MLALSSVNVTVLLINNVLLLKMKSILFLRIIYFANLTLAALIISLTIVRPISIGLVLTGIGAILAAIICGIEIIRKKKPRKH